MTTPRPAAFACMMRHLPPMMALVLAMTGPAPTALAQGEAMQVTCDRSALAAGLQQAAVVAAPSADEAPRPIWLVAERALTLIASDGQVTVHVGIYGARVAGKGQAVVAVTPLLAAANAMTDRTVTLTASGTACRVTGADDTFTINSKSPGVAPPALPPEGEGAFDIQAEALRRTVRQSRFAAAPAAGRAALTGILWEAEEERLTLAATDGHRLAVATGSPAAKARPVRALCPGKFMALLAAGLPGGDEAASVQIDAKRVTVRCGQATWTTGALEDPFPNYKAVVPKSAASTVTLNVEAFAGALRRVTAMSPGEASLVRLSVAAGELKLTCETRGVGDAEVRLAATLEGNPARIALNPRFLLDLLDVLDEETCTLELTAPNQAAAMRVPGLVYVVMPLRDE